MERSNIDDTYAITRIGVCFAVLQPPSSSAKRIKQDKKHNLHNVHITSPIRKVRRVQLRNIGTADFDSLASSQLFTQRDGHRQ